MKRVIIAIVAIILLAGGGAGAYFYMGSADASAGGDVHAVEVEETNLDHLTTTYVEMPPIVLPIIDRDGVSQTISIVVSIEVSDAAKADTVKTRMPKLADAYLSDMYGTLSKKASMQSGVIKVSSLKERLVLITGKVLGEGFVDDVLLQVLQQHQI